MDDAPSKRREYRGDRRAEKGNDVLGKPITTSHPEPRVLAESGERSTTQRFDICVLAEDIGQLITTTHPDSWFWRIRRESLNLA